MPLPRYAIDATSLCAADDTAACRLIFRLLPLRH